jgi:hypothetical protein
MLIPIPNLKHGVCGERLNRGGSDSESYRSQVPGTAGVLPHSMLR